MRTTSVLSLFGLSIGSVLASSSDDTFFKSLLKRQAPGTPAYECHLSCGTAITLSRGSSPCTDTAFLSDYAACLACAGPEDQDIWQYYGETLSAAGLECGLATEPGEEAVSTSEVLSATPTATALPESTTTSVTESVVETTTAVLSASKIEAETTTALVTSSTAVATATSLTTASSVSGGVPSASSVVPFTGNADRRRGSFVAVALAAVAALAI